MSLSRRAVAVKAVLDALPGAVAAPVTPGRAIVPLALMYKVMGKMFAVLSVRGDDYVVLKCDPRLAEVLREQYAGVGHRTHLDRRHWIAVDLGADVPAKEIKRLAAASYELVCAKLSAKQKAELAALTSR